ncbi:hypothetical protein [Kitasatospora sp. NPDC051914]
MLSDAAAGRVLDEPAGQNGNGTPVRIRDSDGDADQHWNFR